MVGRGYREEKTGSKAAMSSPLHVHPFCFHVEPTGLRGLHVSASTEETHLLSTENMTDRWSLAKSPGWKSEKERVVESCDKTLLHPSVALMFSRLGDLSPVPFPSFHTSLTKRKQGS